jgi:hypothetical protein
VCCAKRRVKRKLEVLRPPRYVSIVCNFNTWKWQDGKWNITLNANNNNALSSLNQV